MKDNYVVTTAIECLIFIGAIFHSSSIYEILIKDHEDGVSDYTTDFWPNPLSDPWNEPLF
jgi:hypothetical protein